MNELTPKRVWHLDQPIDPRLAMTIIERVAFGWTLSELENDPNYPPKELFLAWLVKNPEFNQLWHKAREISSYALEDEALYLSRSARKQSGITQNEVAALRLLIDQLRWSADKRNSQIFGPKNHATVVVPIQINTTLDLGEGAKGGGGTADFPNIYEITQAGADAKPNAEAGPDPSRVARPAGEIELMKALEAKRAAQKQATLASKRKANAERMRRERAAKKEKKNVVSDPPDSIQT